MWNSISLWVMPFRIKCTIQQQTWCWVVTSDCIWSVYIYIPIFSGCKTTIISLTTLKHTYNLFVYRFNYISHNVLMVLSSISKLKKLTISCCIVAHLVVSESKNKAHVERAQAYQTVPTVHVFCLHHCLLSGL